MDRMGWDGAGARERCVDVYWFVYRYIESMGTQATLERTCKALL